MDRRNHLELTASLPRILAVSQLNRAHQFNRVSVAAAAVVVDFGSLYSPAVGRAQAAVIVQLLSNDLLHS